MKFILPVILIFIVCISAGCINTPPINPQEELSQAVAESVVMTLKQTVAEAKIAADYSASHGNNEYDAKQALASLYQRASLTHDLIIADENGIVIANYPSSVYIEAGKDLSSYPPNAETFKNTDVYISEYLKAENGQYVYLICVPIVIDGKYSGYVSLSFDPYRLFGEKQEEISSLNYGLFVLETDGLQVYDPDIWEAGTNILKDYDYPEIKKMTEEMCENASGHAYYSFYENEGTEFVNKEVYWQTASFGDREWRIAVTKEIKNN